MPNPVNVNILDTYYMAGLWEGLSPVPSFFRDRYFPTGAGDIYAADKVLVEYRDGDNAMAPFMVMGSDPINVKREGYEIHEYEPTYISQARNLTVDQLKQRGFGEAILSNSTEEERAAKLVSEDLALLERRFSRTEEYLCSQVMINNGFSVKAKRDEDPNHDDTVHINYYDPTKGNDGAYTITQWGAGTTFADVAADIEAMCDALSERGLPAVDLVIGRKVRDFLLSMSDFRDLVNKQSGIIVAEGGIRQTLSRYQGVTFLGTINFNGYELNVIVSNEQYSAVVNNAVARVNYFPATSMMVTAPNAGHLMYAHIVHMDENGDIETITGKRVPDLFVDRKKKKREIILESRPLAAPQNYSPWIYAAGVVA